MNRIHAVRRRNRVLAVAVGIAAGVLFASPAVRADFPFPPTPHELHREVRSLVHDVLRTLDRIPVEIRGGHVGHLEPFLVANTYFGPHRHHHATYSFPVWIDGRVDYRPYVYCNSRLYGTYGARPQFWSGWGVESHGRWCGHHHAYYPTAHACFRPQYQRNYGRNYGSHYRQNYGPSYGPQYGTQHGSQHGSQYGSHYRSNDRSRHGAQGQSHDGKRSGGHHRRGSEHQHDRSCRHGESRSHR